MAFAGLDWTVLAAFASSAVAGWLFLRRQSAAPPAKAGAASAIGETAYEVDVVLGTTLLGGLVTAYYRGALQLPVFLNEVQAALASETLSDAHNVAADLAGEQATGLMAQAGGAFERGISLVSWMTVGLALPAILGHGLFHFPRPNSPQRLPNE